MSQDHIKITESGLKGVALVLYWNLTSGHNITGIHYSRPQMFLLNLIITSAVKVSYIEFLDNQSSPLIRDNFVDRLFLL